MPVADKLTRLIGQNDFLAIWFNQTKRLSHFIAIAHAGDSSQIINFDVIHFFSLVMQPIGCSLEVQQQPRLSRLDPLPGLKALFLAKKWPLPACF
jgi:hypothetical protein